MTIQEFNGLFEHLCHAFDKEFKEGQAIIYFKYIGAYSKEAMQYAVDKSILYHKRHRLPFVSELIDLMKEHREVVPEERRLKEEEFVPITEETRSAFRDLISKLPSANKV